MKVILVAEVHHGHQFILLGKHKRVPALKVRNSRNIQVLHVEIGVTIGKSSDFNHCIIVIFGSCVVQCFLSIKIST